MGDVAEGSIHIGSPPVRAPCKVLLEEIPSESLTLSADGLGRGRNGWMRGKTKGKQADGKK